MPISIVSPMLDPDGTSTTSLVASATESPLVEICREALLRLDASFSPYVIVGPNTVGLWQWLTHTLDQCRAADRSGSYLALAGKDFSRSVGHATTTDGLSEFRDRLDRYDAILIEGLEPVADDSATGRELCGLLERASSQDRLVIFTLSRLPTPQSGWPASLSGRLLEGLSITLNAPPKHLKRELLRQQLASRLDLIPPVLIERWISEPFTTLAEWECSLAVLNEHLAKGQAPPQLLSPLTVDSEVIAPSIDPALLTRTVARQSMLRVADLKGSSRRRTTVLARSVAIYLTRTLTDLSLDAIGRLYGHRDHTTVLHACRKIAAARSRDPEVDGLIDKVCQQLSIAPPSLEVIQEEA